LKPKIVGEDPFDVQRIWEKMWWGTFISGRRGAPVAAMGAIDIAIWDAIGKALNKPVHKLLGGHKDVVSSYGSGVNYGYSKEELVKEMTGFVEEGFRLLKMKIGRQNPEDDLERIKAVRDAIGPSVDLAIDVNNGWSVNNAIRMAKKLEKYDIYWLEEPVMADDVDGLAKLAAETSIPIAVGENHYTKWEFKELIERKAVEIVQPNIAGCGGVTEYMKIAALAEAYGIPVCPHHTEYIDVPLVAAIPNGLFHEYLKEFFVPAGQMYVDPIRPKDGKISPSAKPGFGIELNNKAIEQLKAKPTSEKTVFETKKGWWWPPYL
jgi:D-arabinonate dehydratase